MSEFALAEPIAATTPDEVEAAAATAAAAFTAWSMLTPRKRAEHLNAIAGALTAHQEELVSVAARETALSETRLRGELARTVAQLQLFASTIADGAYLDARIDYADDQFVLGTRPDLRRTLVPRGPVVNFSASNFPFAFSVLGGDTAAALAGGCSVIVKAHSGHPHLSQRTFEVAAAALSENGAPDGVLQVVFGQDAGVSLVRDPRIKAGSFTGSLHVGRLLADEAAARVDPIPFFGELGSINPVVITDEALRERPASIAHGFVASASGSAGQLCTKPGIVFARSAEPLETIVSEDASGVVEHRLLNRSISDGFDARRADVLQTPGVRVLSKGTIRRDAEGNAWVTPTFVAVSLDDFRAAGETLREEAFGPLSIIVETGGGADFAGLIQEFFQGNLTTTLHTGTGESGPALVALVQNAATTSGRVIFNEWPTGVSVTPAMQHGGPWPATTSDSTSVGTAAIQRFLRAVAFQNTPQELLPLQLQDSNPLGIPQSLNAAGSSATWGEI